MGMKIEVGAFSKNDIRDAIMENDAKHVVEMLEKIGLTKGNKPQKKIIMEEHEVLSMILGFAAVKAEKGGLDDELAHELIGRIARRVQIFDFLKFVIATSVAVDPEGYMHIPNKLGKALREDTYCGWINDTIKLLDPNVFRILMDYILNSGEVKALSVNFNTPIISYIYERNIVPHSMVFSMMAINLIQLKSPADDVFAGVLCDINDILDEIMGT